MHALPGRHEPRADPGGPGADPARRIVGAGTSSTCWIACRPPAREPRRSDRPYRRNIENVSYVEAICWIGTRLADALQEAHAHGLVHMDVKPSNVLIAADGSPMLLDFHLACRPIRAGERFPDRIGGTPGWMAPEHRAALDAVARGEPIPEPVDHRADIYALGLLLREALGGPAPASGTGGEPPCAGATPR